jgi:adenylate cyclase
MMGTLHSGRGYRFIGQLSDAEQAASEPAVPGAPHIPVVQQVRFPPARWLIGAACGTLVVLGLAMAWHGGWIGGASTGPRLSVVVLPFENLSGNHAEDYLADAITDDLTSDLSHISGAFVIARESAYTYKGHAIDVRKVGDELGVRYILNGSVRQLGDVLRVNAQLVETKTGAQLWTDRFDQTMTNLGAGQEGIVQRIGKALGREMIQVEAARSVRERPNNPDAIDLVLRARSLALQPLGSQALTETLSLCEHALRLDPSSVPAMVCVALAMINNQDFNPGGRKDMLEHTAALLARARAIEPASDAVMRASVAWLRAQDGRCAETAETAKKLIQAYPNEVSGYRSLVRCLAVLGKADEAIPVIERSMQLDPHDPWQYLDYARMGHVLLLLGRYNESIVWTRRALMANPEAPKGARSWWHKLIAVAYAQSGHLDEAHRSMAEAFRLWPYSTVRAEPFGESSNPVYVAQLARLRDGARLAGARDHAEEDVDFGVPADGKLHQNVAGLTPTSVPGATMIRTDDLVRLVSEHKPIVVDTLLNNRGRSIPDAVGLRYVGEGGDLSDKAQDQLRPTMQELTKGDLSSAIVAVGWNSERFDGRNLALRLVALGYTHVYWYRGGREAWEVKGLPETDLVERDW